MKTMSQKRMVVPVSDKQKIKEKRVDLAGDEIREQSVFGWILSIVVPCITGLAALSWSVENFLGLGIPTIAYVGAIALSAAIVSVSLYLIRSTMNKP